MKRSLKKLHKWIADDKIKMESMSYILTAIDDVNAKKSLENYAVKNFLNLTPNQAADIIKSSEL